MISAPPDDIAVALLSARDPLANPYFDRELAQSYFLFDAWVGGERRVNLHPLLLSPELHRQAIAAAKDAARLLSHVAGRALHDDDEAAHYRFAPDVRRLACASRDGHDHATLMRVDLLLGQDGFVACEINADCPGGHNEALGLPRLAQAAGFWNGHNPTTLCDDLTTALMQMAGDDGAIALIYATAYAEDLQVCALIQRELARRGARAILCSPTALRRRGRRLYVGDQAIGALYRYFPTEFMEGQRNLDDIAAVVAAGGVRTLSNFTAIYTQSKLAMARAHALAATLPADLAPALRRIPSTCALSDVPADQLTHERDGWVIKRALGRVGEEVFVGSLLSAEDWARACQMAFDDHARGEPWIAQRFVPQRPIPSPYGPLLVTLGAYLLNGSPVGYFARLTPDSHASHSALCLPVFVRPASPDGGDPEHDPSPRGQHAAAAPPPGRA